MDLHTALHAHFGHAEFRPPQEEVVRTVLAGRDVFVLMATGEGKSLCFQLPALLRDGVTLVVSPLIALMEDQVAGLRARRLPATCIHSQIERGEREARMAAVQGGTVRLLYVTPERFRVAGFLESLRPVRIAHLAVDEAHCVSQWGHDFRPDYTRLGAMREALGNPPCIALTATATPRVQADIAAQLRLRDPVCFHTGVERTNLYLGVHEVAAEDDKEAIAARRLGEVGGPAIVYFALIRDLLRVEGSFRRRGLRPLVYHGDLGPGERKDQQARFQAEPAPLILATNAFGLGIDKPDIRLILHWQVPRTLEAYYQEVGRAGRDRLGSVCELLYLEQDLAIQREFTEWANPDREFLGRVSAHLAHLEPERLRALAADDLRAVFLGRNRHDGRVETCLRLLRTAGCLEGEFERDLAWVRTPTPDEISAWLPEDKRENDLRALLAMVRYARATSCRKRIVHEYFGFAGPESGCGSCDHCVGFAEWIDRELPAQRRHPVLVLASSGVRRGDWLEIQGLGLCEVLRVLDGGATPRVDVEVAESLERRSVDLRRTRWRRIDARG